MEPSPRKSKRPSAGLTAKLPEASLTFFIDRDTGGRLLAAELRKHGYSVELHDAHFAQDTQDPFWIRKVAERGWVILTCDRTIVRKEPEKSLFGTAPTHTFILYALAYIRREQRLPLVLTVLPKLSTLVASGVSKGIYRVHANGQIERVEVAKPKFRLEDF